MGIYARSDSTGPETATGWKYYNHASWNEPSSDNDILVELGNTTKDLFIKNRSRTVATLVLFYFDFL